jgi:phage recombination protein Bet
MKNIEKTAPDYGADVEKIRKYLETMGLANNLTKSEVEQFIEIAQGFQLNPFKREIYANKYGDKFSVIVGFETYIKRAERSGLLNGWNVRVFGGINPQNVMNSDLRAEITIHRRDFEHPFVHDVYYSEYVGRKRDGSITEFWRNKPITMIKKVAMAQGFRLCFSDELGGMPYTSEELSAMEADAVVVDTKIKKPKPVNEKPKVDDTIRIRTLMDGIREINNVDELLEVWNANNDLHHLNMFKSALSTRKSELAEIERKRKMDEHFENIKSEIENESDINALMKILERNEEMPNVRVYVGSRVSYVKLIEQIEKCESIEQIMDLTMDETNQSVLQFAQNKINQLTESTQPTLFDNENV